MNFVAEMRKADGKLPPMELYAERLRLAAQAETAARGQSPAATEVPSPVRVKLARAWKNASQDVIITGDYVGGANQAIAEALEISLGHELAVTPECDLRLTADGTLVLSILEAMDQSFDREGLLDAENGLSFFRSEVIRGVPAARRHGRVAPLSRHSRRS